MSPWFVFAALAGIAIVLAVALQHRFEMATLRVPFKLPSDLEEARRQGRDEGYNEGIERAARMIEAYDRGTSVNLIPVAIALREAKR